MLKAAIIGFGSISRSHRKEYLKLEQLGKVKLVCAYDVDPDAFSRVVKNNLENPSKALPEKIRYYTDLDEMLEKEEIDFVDICVPSYWHSEMSVKLLKRGYHVLCEKPMALHYSDCLAMIEAAKEADKELMIGQCLRFYPAFDEIKRIIDQERFGALQGAFFSRLNPLPTWGWKNWFADPALSGGGVTDFHVHDIDILRYLLGEPDAVSSRGTSSFSLYDALHTSLFYGKIPVTVISDWTHMGIPFSAGCYFNFEKATVVFDSSSLTVAHKKTGEREEIPLEQKSGYFGEISYFCDVIEGKIQNTKNPASSAALSIRLIETIKKSADANGEVLEYSID